MNLVKTYTDKSDIQGIGLFANEFIPEGTKMWEISGFDIVVDDESFKSLPLTEEQLKYVKRYIYFNNGYWIYCGDDAKFTNHSNEPNTMVGFTEQIALKDIYPGEEITCNYHSLDKDFTEEEFNEE
jgi:uncharacterized protein